MFQNGSSLVKTSCVSEINYFENTNSFVIKKTANNKLKLFYIFSITPKSKC